MQVQAKSCHRKEQRINMDEGEKNHINYNIIVRLNIVSLIEKISQLVKLVCHNIKCFNSQDVPSKFHNPLVNKLLQKFY